MSGGVDLLHYIQYDMHVQKHANFQDCVIQCTASLFEDINIVI